MRKLSPEERDRIEAAVAAAEKRTSVEFAVVVAQASDEYAFFPLLWAGVLALLSGGAIAIAMPVLSTSLSFAIQAGVFIAAGLLLQLKYLRPHLAPPATQRAYASRMAQQQFAALVNEQTRGDVGLLLFVSLAERHVEVLADNGIGARIPQSAFQSIIKGFIQDVHRGKIADGFIAAIEGCTLLLQQHFPARPDEPDEIANRVTEI
ncbi:MAG: TPM domain-containing protein [Pseudomonadota bacterium]